MAISDERLASIEVRATAYGETPPDQARDLLRGRLGNELWDAINRYALECGGDPSTNVYGAMRRQAAVAEIVRVVEAVAAAAGAREFVENAPRDLLDLVAELRRVRALVRVIVSEMRSRSEGIAKSLDYDAITNRQGADEMTAIVDDAARRLRAAVMP